VELVGDVSIVLDSGFELVLKNTFYVPSFRRNLISISLLDELGFCFTFGSRKISMALNSQIVGCGILVDGLYKLTLTSDIVASSLVVENLFLKGQRLRKNHLLYGISV
jgi:hypothetical protein